MFTKTLVRWVFCFLCYVPLMEHIVISLRIILYVLFIGGFDFPLKKNTKYIILLVERYTNYNKNCLLLFMFCNTHSTKRTTDAFIRIQTISVIYVRWVWCSQPVKRVSVLQFTRPTFRNSLRPSTRQGTKRSIAQTN